MKKFKRVTTAIITLSLIIANIVPCYAETGIDAITNYSNLYNQIQSDLDENNPIQGNILKQFVDYNYTYGMGLLIDYNENVLSDILSAIRGYSSGGHGFTLPANATDEEVINSASEYLTDNINVTDNSITYNDNSRNMLLYLSNEYMKNCGYYEAYAFDLRNMTNSLPTTAQYNALRDLIGNSNSNITTDYKFCVVWGSYANVAICPFEDYGLLLRSNVTNWGTLNYADTNVYSYANGNTTPVNGGFQKFTWNSVSQNYIQDSNPYGSQLANVRVSTRPNQSTNANAFVLSYGEQLLPVFQTSGDATSYGVGIKPYYYNTKTWNDFSTSSGDYTVDSSSVNTVTYGDTVTYIQDSYNETGNYPDNSTVNNWIDNSNQNNHNGGGSGSGGGDSGGGSSDSNIFEFLSDIGAVLGNLIKNLGNVLTELVSGIAEIISGLFEAIPTVFGDFMGGLLGWMPEELRALIILGISAMIIVGIIKIIRG